MGLALPVELIESEQPDVCLVDERGRLQRVVGTFLAHVADGDFVQLPVEVMEQFGRGKIVFRLEPGEQAPNLALGRGFPLFRMLGLIVHDNI